MKKRTEKKVKAKKTPVSVEGVSEAKAKPEAKDLPARELLEGVSAIVLKKGKLAVTERQCVYETANAYCVFDRDLHKRIHWILKKRVVEIEKA